MRWSILFVFLLLIPGVFAAESFQETKPDSSFVSGSAQTVKMGVWFTMGAHDMNFIYGNTTTVNANEDTMYLYWGNGTLIKSASIDGTNHSATFGVTLEAGEQYQLVSDASGGSRTYGRVSTPGYPLTESALTYNTGVFNFANFTSSVYIIRGLTVENVTSPSAESLTLRANDIVKDSFIDGYCAGITGTNWTNPEGYCTDTNAIQLVCERNTSNDGTPTGTVTYGSGITLNGASSIDIGNSKDTWWHQNKTTIIADVTINGDQSGWIFASRDDNNGAFSVYRDSSDLFRVYSGTSSASASGMTLDAGGRYEIAAVFHNATYVQYYVNGTSWAGDPDDTLSGSNWDASDTVMLGNRESSSSYINATIHSISVYNDTLTSSEISAEYSSSSPARCTGLKYYATGAEYSGTTLYDESYHCTGIGMGTYNISYYNISENTFYNKSLSNIAFTSSQSHTINTSQALINTSVFTLFLNNTVSGFNITNNKTANTTTTTWSTIAANLGVNNLQVDVEGNYSINASCLVSTLFTTPECNITGVYDHILTVGTDKANVFNLTAENTTIQSGIAYSGGTTTGALEVPLIRNYNYLLEVTPQSYSIANATVSTSGATSLYNFTLLQLNTFNLSFFNESDDSLLDNQTVYIELISEDYANNYTTNNGTIQVSLLTPGEYSIRYYIDSDVPRDYYVTLSDQSYHTLRLYTVDEEVSNLYIATLRDESGQPVEAATFKLMRYFIADNNYRVVEMSKTDTNGKAVMRVVPNIINYKFVIVKDSSTLPTEPTKFTSQTDDYTINLQGNPLESLLGIDNVAQLLEFINATNTYRFTWTDNNNLVSGACLEVTKQKSGALTQEYYACTTGATGSLIHTVLDTNNTKYSAIASINTTTEFSTYHVGPLTIDYTDTVAIFGLVGIFLTLLVFLAFAMSARTSEGSAFAGVLAIVMMGAIGFIAQRWESVVGMVIIAAIIMYKTRT